MTRQSAILTPASAPRPRWRRLCLVLSACAVLAACNEDAAPRPEADGAPAVATGVIRTNPFDAARTDSLRGFAREYVRQVEQDLIEIYDAVHALQDAIQTLLDTPDQMTLAAAREAWLIAHGAYERATLDRYFANLVLPEPQALALFQLRYQLNHWPILPGYLDSVAGYADSGIVNDITVELTPENLRRQHGEFDLGEATLGFHVIEFLLWGSNPDGNSPRTPHDYVPVAADAATRVADGIEPEQLPTHRRRQLLALTTAQLVLDATGLLQLWIENSASVQADIAQMSAPELLTLLMGSMTELLTEELLVSALYPMLNGDFTDSVQSPYSHSTQVAVAAQLSGLDRLLLENRPDSGINLDALINSLSDNFNDFFYQNFDTSKECLVLLFSELEAPQDFASTQKTEFEIVECINLVTNMIDHLDQVRTSIQ